jgi:hypothetical protein
MLVLAALVASGWDADCRLETLRAIRALAVSGSVCVPVDLCLNSLNHSSRPLICIDSNTKLKEIRVTVASSLVTEDGSVLWSRLP